MELILYQITLICSLLSIQYLCGLLVKKKDIKVNYTRKIVHFALFFLPFFLEPFFFQNTSPNNHGVGMMTNLSTYLLLIKPIRSRVKPLNTAFMSLDRPEDRPNTLKWIFLQNILAALVMFPLSIMFSINNMEFLIFIPIFINAIGDGLAEPIGIRFGKHKYQTYALFSKKKYVRSIEGSSCVFITSLALIIIFSPCFTFIQFSLALLIIPISMTISEAFSPHTLDNPFLFLVCGLLLVFIIQI